MTLSVTVVGSQVTFKITGTLTRFVSYEHHGVRSGVGSATLDASDSFTVTLLPGKYTFTFTAVGVNAESIEVAV